MQITQAAPLLLCPLSKQIKELGGEGSNCDCEVISVKGSFSTLYGFNTNVGKQYLLTRNEYQICVLEDSQYHHVMFNADNGEYTLVTPKSIKQAPHKILSIISLGHSFNAMKDALQKLMPNRCVWNLIDPNTVLASQ